MPSLTALNLSGDGRISGAGLIQVTATASLDAAVPGTGMIICSGNPPPVTTSITGSGTGSVTPG